MSRKGPGEAPREDPLKEAADKLRAKGGIEWRTAILGEQRVEYIRGKDFATYFRQNEGQMLTWVSRGLKLDDQIRTLGELMLRKRLFVKADRMFKKPKPGKKRLAKWPKKLVPLYADPTWQEDCFYAWQYDRPSSPWLFVLSVLLVAVVLLFCLFPLAPQPLKLAVVYLSMGLLAAIFGLLAARTALAALSWLAIGRTLWLFPHLLSEEKGLDEAFWPLLQLEGPREGRSKALQAGLRVAFGLALLSLGYGLYRNPPDKGAALGGAKEAHDAILDMLNLRAKSPSIGFQGNATANASSSVGADGGGEQRRGGSEQEL